MLTRECEKVCTLMSSLIQFLAASLPKTSFLIPLFISPETQIETAGVTVTIQILTSVNVKVLGGV